MDKIKIVSVFLLIPFFVLIVFTLLKVKDKEEYQQKIVLAQDTHKVLGRLMIDLRDARENTIQEVPADGQWHGRFAFENTQQGSLEYIIKDGHLLRISSGKALLIADNIGDLRIRRQKETPDILEIQLQAQNDTSLISNLKIRIQE